MWTIWKNMNAMIFNNVGWTSIVQVWRELLRTLRFWWILAPERCRDRLHNFITLLEDLTKNPLSIASG